MSGAISAVGNLAGSLLGLGRAKTVMMQTPPAPTYEDASLAGEQKADELRKRRGMASTILAGSQPQSSTQPVTQAAKLLGS